MDLQKSLVTADIKHGNAPEIQEVNIRNNSVGRIPGNSLEANDSENERYGQLRPLSKTMTTKSTMTNDDAFDIETETQGVPPPCASPVSDSQVEKKDKAVAWKNTPRVHFPPHFAGFQLLREKSPKAIRHNFMEGFTPTGVLECHYALPEPTIDPTFCHKPDKSFSLRNNKTNHMKPLKVWSGYGGNIYFRPVEVCKKTINAKERESGKEIVVRRTISSTSRRTTWSPDPFSDSNSRAISLLDDHETFGKDAGLPHLAADRKMAVLDRDYVLNMPRNVYLHEDWAWICGAESIGTLRLENPTLHVQRQSNKEGFTRKTIVEKIPRRFVFHPQKHKMQYRKRERADSESTIIAKYGRSRNYQQYALRRSDVHLISKPGHKKGEKKDNLDETIHVFPRNQTHSLKVSGRSVNEPEIKNATPLILSLPRLDKPKKTNQIPYATPGVGVKEKTNIKIVY